MLNVRTGREKCHHLFPAFSLPLSVLLLLSVPKPTGGPEKGNLQSNFPFWLTETCSGNAPAPSLPPPLNHRWREAFRCQSGSDVLTDKISRVHRNPPVGAEPSPGISSWFLHLRTEGGSTCLFCRVCLSPTPEISPELTGGTPGGRLSRHLRPGFAPNSWFDSMFCLWSTGKSTRQTGSHCWGITPLLT